MTQRKQKCDIFIELCPLDSQKRARDEQKSQSSCLRPSNQRHGASWNEYIATQLLEMRGGAEMGQISSSAKYETE
jgi:hypothetical protein